MSEKAYIALGSNLGNRQSFLMQGRSRLSQLPQTTLVAESSIEETAPIGPEGQGHYLNQMVVLQTELSPRELLHHCQAIEFDAGRTRGERWGARTLDLDIVRFGDLNRSWDDLVLPHPQISNRPFWQREIVELEQHVQNAAELHSEKVEVVE